ncbi:MAG: adenylate/guanylate cyclase domain-containing protein [Proteobacteria bacterium]|nr:adenylate/guanylate cyclase domain-containing protein [Pseudomonadota bacterium]
MDSEAAVLLSDISGFTQLSEKLIGEHGAEGIDRLTAVLDEQFGRWVDIVADLGGEVVKFAGDALLAVWFADDLGGLQQAVAAAGECVLAIADSMERHASVDDVPLSLRVGLGAGPFSAARIGGVRGR